MTLAVDHLVVAADSLAQGAAWCEATLGVTPGPGGRHALFGTHNRLLSIASTAFPRSYLEIIAIDPDAPPPQRARWFGLDDAALRERLRAAPRLLHVVVRTSALRHDRQRLVELGLDPGDVLQASRPTPAGLLSWQIVVRPDGRLQAGGALPTLIQWDGPHPADTLPASGVTLQDLVLRGLAAPVREMLSMPGVTCAADAGPALSATLSTPAGPVVLAS